MLEAAYDDSQGVTAEFNRNVLRVINRELDADFAPEAFEHIAFYDRAHEWIEMRLRARRPCSVLVAGLGLRVEFAAGEELRTEISAKFTRSRIEADFQAAGLALEWLAYGQRRTFCSVAGPPAIGFPTPWRSEVVGRSSRAARRASARRRHGACTRAARTS